MNENINVNERISFKTTNVPHIALYLLIPIEFVGVCVFIVYAAFHWSTFVGQSAALFSWLAWFAGLVLYTGLAWLAVKVLRSGIEALLALAHGVAEIHGKFIENRIARARRELLHTDTNYVVYLDRGKVTVQSVIQERYTYNIRQANESQSALPGLDEVESLPAPVQTFRELLESGIVQQAIREGRMILGYTGGVLRYGSWLDLYSCGIGGVSGSGKTTTVRFLLFQAILAGARLIMIDPHIEEQEESLAAQFRQFTGVHIAQPCNDAPASVLKRIRWLEKERQRRKLAGVKSPAIVLVIDEYNALMRVDDVKKELSALLLSIAQEGRKFGLFAMLIGQRWSHQDIGGADIRTSLASTLAHRFTDEEQAKKLVGSRNGARCLELPQGHYLFRDTQGALSEMITPLTTMEDGDFIQSILNARAGAENTVENTEKTRETTPLLAGKQGGIYALPALLKAGETTGETTEKTPITEQRQDAETARMMLVARLHSEGKTKPEIIRAVWNVNPGGSQAYETANSEYQSIMRRVYEQLGA